MRRGRRDGSRRPRWRPLPTRSLGPAWREADLIVYMTSHKLHYRPEIRAALDAGTRVLCAMQPLHVMERLTADAEARRRTIAGAALLDAARIIRITSLAGTDLTMDKAGRPGLAHYGAADEPGHFDFRGGAMAQAAQLEGTTEGRLVCAGDCCFHLGRMVEQRTVIELKVAGPCRSRAGSTPSSSARSCRPAARRPRSWPGTWPGARTTARAGLQPLVQTPDAGGGGADRKASSATSRSRSAAMTTSSSAEKIHADASGPVPAQRQPIAGRPPHHRRWPLSSVDELMPR